MHCFRSMATIDYMIEVRSVSVRHRYSRADPSLATGLWTLLGFCHWRERTRP